MAITYIQKKNAGFILSKTQLWQNIHNYYKSQGISQSLFMFKLPDITWLILKVIDQFQIRIREEHMSLQWFDLSFSLRKKHL